MDLSIIIVNWNVCELLRRCLISIHNNHGGLSLEVIVVDNASSDDSVAMVEQEFPQVRLIASQENLGYGGGNNLGAKGAQGRYLLVLNPDTEIVGYALEKMVEHLDDHPKVGIVGPQLRYPDGSIQLSRYRFPQLGTAFLAGTLSSQRWFRNNRFKRSYLMADQPNDKVQSVDWLMGAALMIRRETWQEVGQFDERLFMYFDDIDWCHRCRDKGWEIHYLPPAQIVHYHGGATDKTGAVAPIRFYRSKVFYFRKYFGAGWGVIIHLFLLMDLACMLAIEIVKWAIDRREARREQMRVYCQTLKSGLRGFT